MTPLKTVCKVALTALVNLTDSITVCAELTNLEGFVDWLLQAVSVRPIAFVQLVLDGLTAAFYRILARPLQTKRACYCRICQD